MSKEWSYDPTKTIGFKLRKLFHRAKSALRRDPVQVYGLVKYELRDSITNIVKETRYVENLITTVGFEAIAQCVAKSSGRPAVFTYIAIGTGTNAAVIGDTTLQTESARQDATASYTYNAGTKTWSINTTYAAGVATGAITESGVLNAAASGTLLNRQVFLVINKGANDTLTVTWSFSLS